MIFGKGSIDDIAPLTIGGVPIDVVHEIKYLGTTIVSGVRFSFTARHDVSKFFCAANSILNVLNDAHEHILLQLIYSNCVPILMYASPVKLLSSAEMMYCSKAMNDVLRKIFGFTDWRSI